MVSKSMKLNVAIFGAPPVNLKDLDTQVDELEQAQIDTFFGGEKETLIRNQKRKKLENSLKKLGLYVSQLSDGDATVIHKASMLAKGKPSKLTNILTKPVILRADSIQSGKIRLNWKKVAHARIYSVEYCEDLTQGKWQNAGSCTATRNTVNGLDKSKEYWFRVTALGINGMVSDASDNVSCVVI
jgi:hypothetical protein